MENQMVASAQVAKRGWTIGLKLLTISLALLIVPSLVIGFTSFTTAKSNFSSQLDNHDMTSVKVFNQDVNTFISQREQTLTYLAKLLNSTALDESSTLPALEGAAQSYADFLHVYVGTNTGAFYVSPAAKMPAGYDPRKRSWYQAAMTSPTPIVTPPYVDAITKQLTVTIAERLANGRGVVGADISLKTFDRLVNQVPLGNSGYLGLMDGQSNVIAMHGLAPGSSLHLATLKQMYQHDSGIFSVAVKGASYRFTYVTNAATGWKVIGILPTSSYMRAVHPILVITLIVLGISLILGFLTIWYLVRSITRPLHALVEFAERVGRGDLTTDVVIKTRDELGVLGGACNHMLHSLRDIIRRVEMNAEQVAASSEQLTASAEENTRATEQITNVVGELAASVTEQSERAKRDRERVDSLASNIEEVATSASVVAQVAEATAAEADRGSSSAESAVHQMEVLGHSFTGLSTSIQELTAYSGQIHSIIAVIQSIATQTNLLALNAAIEAARAGESGRGFAVVAEEIRKLADQSSSSANEIQELIESMQVRMEEASASMEASQQDVQHGIEAVNHAGELFANIRAGVVALAEEIRSVTSASQAMAASANSLREFIAQVESATVETSAGMQTVSASTEEQLASMEEISASAASLAELAEQMQAALQQFSLR
ncbi:methyl-accepting chemotaxis protein [Alicyclobacillus hesperidum subsp. aegles]|uniref:methyl-accepting chemotaxis protein n=1 Tax=Alicyclobacillus hesperidum TaxID=89784 RepID=UPI00222CF910|nr:methyl-accepting chemotaxis protein [Alicyclobacillus hesperidum]GLG01497.1 methyl-accepting chemotaxis protein [Alicyclobacillus hesperidum subsp. aegles]